MRGFSGLYYQIQIKPGKHMTVYVNRMKRNHEPPRKAKSRESALSIPEWEHPDDECNDSDNEPAFFRRAN